jgi:ABC-2 type transport system permease protein
MIATLKHGWIITQRDLLHWVKQPAGPIFGLMFFVMLLLMFGFLFGGAIEVPGGGDYIQFLLPGMLALTMMFGVENTMLAMSTDAQKGITDRFRSMPISSASIVLGRSGADMAQSVLGLAILMGGGLLIGWRLDATPAAVVAGIALLLWLRFALLWVGIFLGLMFRGPGATMAVQVLVWPIGFLSNVFVAPETMPAWLGAIAEWNPVSATATAARQLFGNPTGVTDGWLAESAVLMSVAWPLALTLLFLPLSARAYRKLRS